ncbi:MAG: hypothetical protein ACE5GA_04490 [Candidatus Zixiibacteriota bacterium]
MSAAQTLTSDATGSKVLLSTITALAVASFALMVPLDAHSQTVGDTAKSSESASDSAASPPSTPHFVPIPDRWNGIKPPPYELNVKGHWYDPYNQNKLKGDYPIFGQNTFLVLTAVAQNIVEGVRAPTPSGISVVRPKSPEFFGQDENFINNETVRFTVELYHGDAAFRPRDWEIKITPALNLNYVNSRENTNVNINVRKGDNRADEHLAFEDLSFEKHLFNLNRNYDFVSLRAGIQKFSSDFRGFIFTDHNLGARLFGNAGSNKYQYNLAYFNMLEKETNSELNTIFDDRKQDVYIANLYKQDFLTLGYTTELSLHYNRDYASVHFDENGIPVRPAVLGNVRPHEVKSIYLGWAGDGHLGRMNISHAFYQVLGTDDFNSLAGQELDINAQMAALELSVDKDWMRFKTSVFYASGDSDPMDETGRGFDAIIDQQFFAGGPFSYWNLVGLRLLGVGLTHKLSILPSMRSNKFEGQSNFVNPGLLLLNIGHDAELTPELKTVININYLSFAQTEPLQNFLNQPNIGNEIGLDYSLGVIYRPFLNNNAQFTASAAALTPYTGFIDIYDTKKTQFALAASLTLTY